MPTPPPFPFRRTGRVIYSSRGLYGWAAFIVLVVVLTGALAYFFPGDNSTTTVVVLCCFLGAMLAMGGWCVYCGRRVQIWEREYERVMGHKFGA